MTSRTASGYHIAAIAAIFAFLFIPEYVPLQDYPDWLYQGYLFKHYVFFGDTFDGYYSMYPYLPPNAISTVLIAFLSFIFSPIIAGKIFLLLAMLLVYFGINGFIKHYSPQSALIASLVAFYFAFSTHLLVGNVNFVFGLGALFCLYTHAVRRDKTRNLLFIAASFFVLYLCHFLICLLFGIFLLANAMATRTMRDVMYTFIGAVPTTILLLHYAFTKSLTNVTSGSREYTFAGLLSPIFSALATPAIPFHRYKGVLEPPEALPFHILLIVNYTVAFLLIAIAAYGIISSLRRKNLSILLLVSVVSLMFIIFSPYELGGLFGLNDRFVIVFYVCIISLCINQSSGVRKFLLWMFLIISPASYIWNMVNMFRFSQTISAGTPYDLIEMEKEYHNREGQIPYSQLDAYEAIEKHRIKTNKPIFITGFFTYKGADPRSFDGR